MNKDNYYENKKLYTLKLDFNDKNHSTFHQEYFIISFLKLYLILLVINFLEILQNITYFLNFKKCDGELFLPIDYQKSLEFSEEAMTEKWLDYNGNELISKNELYGEYELNYNEEKNIQIIP